MEEKRVFFNHQIISDNKTEINFTSREINETITISNFNYILDYKSSTFSMIRAEIQIGKNEPVNICFKLSNNLSIYDLKDSRVFQQLFKLGKFNNLVLDEYNYIGALTRENPKDYKLTKKQEDVKYINKSLNQKKIQDNDIEIEEENEENNVDEQDEIGKGKIIDDVEEQKIYKIKEDSDRFIKTYFQERGKQSFSITDIRVEKIGKNDYKKYVACKGSDIKTGEKFEITELTDENIVGKNGENSYVYNGYIEKEEEKKRFPIIFELPYTIKDAVNRQNILPMLELLSKDENIELKENQLNFLGRIDEENKLKREECSSKESKNYLLKQIKEYALRTRKRNKENQEDKELS